ncbi:MAG: nucleotidyltransferase family protein [Alphaproteobacteria bacterium]
MAPPAMSATPRHAMVLAAGRGDRLRPLTDRVPKPLVTVGGRTVIDRLLDALDRAGVERAVVNTWHLADNIASALEQRTRPAIVISREVDLLDTGGGTFAALPHLGPAPFYVASAKMVWRDGPRPALARLAEAWDDERMDALLLVQPMERALGFHGAGDFFLDADGLPSPKRSRFGFAQAGRIAWRGAAARAPYAYTSLQIVHPRLFRGAPAGAFSFRLPWDAAIVAGRAHGLVHDGAWCDVSTPEGLAEAEAVDWDG